MSTILKALRRLERDKSTPAESRSLREAVTAGGAEPSRGSDQPVWLVPGIALVLGIAVGAGFLWLLPHGEAESAAAAETVVARAEIIPVPAPARPAPAPAPREREIPREMQAMIQEAGVPADAFSSPVAVVDRPARQPRIPPPPAEPEFPEPLVLVEPDVPLAIVQAQAAAVPDPWLVETVVPESAPELPPVLEAPATSLPEPPAPTLPVVKERGRTLPRAEAPIAEAPVPAPEPDSVREPEHIATPAPAPPEPVAPPPAPSPVAEAPTPALADPPATALPLRVLRTWWHPVAGRREAQVSSGDGPVRVQEGDRVGDATVVEIEPSAVVFGRGEVEFRRVVGEDASD